MTADDDGVVWESPHLEYLARTAVNTNERKDVIMATAVRAKSGRSSRKVAAWHDEAGELLWRCPDCEKVNPDTLNVCACEYVRPPLKKLQALARQADNGIPATLDEAELKAAAAEYSDQLAADDAILQEARPGKRNGRASKAGPTLDEAWHLGYGEMDVACDSIATRPDNPRKHFDETYLATLAESIRGVGLINRIVIRLTRDGGHELWAGECRLRAVRDVLQRRMIPAKVYGAAVPDEKMEAIRAWENLQREDLDAIEEAACLKQLLGSGAYANQRDLAAALGISQTELSMRIRLVDLPEAWRTEVIAHGKTQGTEGFSASHVKHLYPWLERPPVLEKALKLANEWRKARGRRPSERDFEGIVSDAVEKCTRSLSKPSYQGDRGCLFKVTPDLRQELDVVEVPRRWGGGKEARAFNVKLYNQHQDAAKQKKKAREAKQADEPQASGKSKAPKPPAFEWFHLNAIESWAGRQIAARLGTKQKDATFAWKLCLLLMQSEDFYDWGRDELGKRFGITKRWAASDDWWKVLEKMTWSAIEQAIREFVLARLSTGPQLDDRISDRERSTLLVIAGELGADLETEWQPEAKDLEDWPIEAIRSMASQFGMSLTAGKKTDKQLAGFVAKIWKPGNVPKEILAAAGIKG